MKEKNLFDVLGLIALRKAEFYTRVVKEARKRKIEINEKEIEEKMASIDNEKFISDKEKRDKKLYITTTLDSLDLDIESFLRKSKEN